MLILSNTKILKEIKDTFTFPFLFWKILPWFCLLFLFIYIYIFYQYFSCPPNLQWHPHTDYQYILPVCSSFFFIFYVFRIKSDGKLIILISLNLGDCFVLGAVVDNVPYRIEIRMVIVYKHEQHPIEIRFLREKPKVIISKV